MLPLSWLACLVTRLWMSNEWPTMCPNDKASAQLLMPFCFISAVFHCVDPVLLTPNLDPPELAPLGMSRLFVRSFLDLLKTCLSLKSGM